MSEKIEKPMSETTIYEASDKKRHREEVLTTDEHAEVSKRRELSPTAKGSSVVKPVTSDFPAPVVTSFKSTGDSRENQDTDDSEHKKRSDVDTSTGKHSTTNSTPGPGQAKGFGGISMAGTGFANTNSASSFASLLSKSGQDSAFSSVINNPSSSSIFSQDTAADTNDKEKLPNEADEQEDNTAPGTQQDEEQYVVVKGLEKTKVPTGEEGETCIHLVRAKLYAINPQDTEAGWKERGVGNLRILRDESKRTRLVMRADAVLRVILNLPLHPKYKLEGGGESMGDKTIRLFGVEDGTGVWLALRVGNKNAAEELKDMIKRGMDETPINEKNEDDVKDNGIQPIQDTVSGIVPHNEASRPKAAESDQVTDPVETTEIENETEILKEKADLEDLPEKHTEST